MSIYWIDEVQCEQQQIKKTMNKAENVPIATLSGIASLTEITPELPLPASTSSKDDIQLFSSQQDANESINLVNQTTHSQKQIESFEKLLSSVNNAYLDFKNSIYNRPSVFTDLPHLPAIIQHVTQNRPDVFQPHFDTYHGSPLKTNNVSALAYSPNQRNAFIMHHQQQPSPLLQGSQFSFSSNSPATVKVPANHQPVNKGKHHLPSVLDEGPFSPLGLNPPDDGINNIKESKTSISEDALLQNSMHGNNNLDEKPINVNGQCISKNYTDLDQFVPDEFVPPNELKEVEIRLRRKRKKKHKQKPDRIDENNEFSNKKVSPNNQLDDQNLVLRVPKLIVRKVKKIQGDNEVETLEVCRTEKEKKLSQTDTPLVVNECHSIQNETPSVVKEEQLQVNETPAVADEQQLKPINSEQQLNENETASVALLLQTDTSVIVNEEKLIQNDIVIENENDSSMPETPLVANEESIQNDIIEKVDTPGKKTLRSAEPVIQNKKRTRHKASSVSSGENLQVQKRKKGQTNYQESPSSAEEKNVEIEPVKVKKGRGSSSKCKESTAVSDYEYDPNQGCSSSSNIRTGRRKRVNYKESASASDDDDDSEQEQVKVIKVKKRRSRGKRDSASDGEYDPNQGVRTRRGRSSNYQDASSPEPAISSKPEIDAYWDESDEDDNEEIQNLNKELDAQGVKTEVKKFMYIMEKILDHELELEADGNLDINDDVEIPPESLISRHLVSALCTEVAKMKSSGKLSEMPVDQMVRIIAIMDRHVKDSIQLLLTQDEDGEEERQWYLIQIERLVRSAEAAAVILHITTAPDMPKQVYLEEAIERVSSLCQFHLENTVFPEFDPIYKVFGDKDVGYNKKSRRYRSTGAKSKSIHKVYNKFCEVVSLLANLLSQESLTDSIILKMSQIGISPFFVEHVSILQLEALKVSRAIFRNYVKHRDLILEDILASLSRLPSTKRNLRTYRLQENDFIQMFTALVLQLIQCTVQIPMVKDSDSQGDSIVDKDVLIVKSYEDALRVARNFLSVFLKKCSSKNDENDFRPLFENFLHDLFITANLPEWPAAEVLLTQLGHLFVVTFSNTKLEMTLRTSALDYLSQIATHLRKASLKSEEEGEKEKLKSLIEKLINTKDVEEEVPITDDLEVYDEKLRQSLLLFLLSCSDNDPSFKYAREFYLGQWIRDVQMEIEKSMIAPMLSIPGAAGVQAKNKEEQHAKAEISSEKLQVLQEKKEFYHSLIEDVTVSILKSSQPMTYETACITVDHLASSRSFSQSFDLYMQQIFKMLSEQAIALRTKAVKALTMIVSIDPNILAREDVQASVHGRLLDPSTNVREAAVDLIGQFVLKCPNLIKQYYDMIIARILDTGVSVRKRVIKILQNICLEHPDFEKIPEICAKMIRRVEDESGIKKLVTEVFRTMWFQPIKNVNKDSDQLYQKAVNITKVISLCKDTGFDWLECLLDSLFDDNENSSTVAITACQQLVDCLFSRLLKPELKSDSNIVVSCLITLYLFCKSYPNLLIAHATTLQPYLSSKIETPTDSLIIQHVSKILEIVVPLMEHPSPKFLAELEEDSMKLMLKQSQNIVQSCASCLASIINNVTHNYKFIVDGFSQFHKFLMYYKQEHIKDANNSALKAKRPSLLRALFTIGLFCRHFDLDTHVPEESENCEEKMDKDLPRSEQVFDLCMYFTDFADELITLKAILAIGFIGVRYPKLLLKDACRNLYQEILSPLSTSTKAKFTVLKSLQNHLIEEELRLQQAEKRPSEKNKRKKDGETSVKEDIKELGDALSGTTSEIIQVLLKDIMKGFFHCEKQVRISALQVVAIILRQGLIHPAQCIPSLIAISTDTEHLCHVKAEQCLNDLDSRYQGFIHMKAVQGVKMSYEIQSVIQKSDGGYLVAYRETENKTALINHVYSLIRSNKQYRRPFLLSLLKQADDVNASSNMRYYIVENLAYIGYSTHEEPLFILYHIDKNASVSGANILEKFKELFHPPSKKRNNKNDSDSDDEEEDESQLENCQVDETELMKIVKQSFGCMLLLELKKYLKTIYGFTDSKCQKYSPTEPSKMYERPLNRKCDMDFVSEYKDFMFSTVTYEKMVKYYLQFKKMMMSLDKEQDSDSDDDDKPTKDEINSKTEEKPAARSSKEEAPPNTETASVTPGKPETSRASPAETSKKEHGKTNASNFEWTLDLKIRLVEASRDCKVGGKGYMTRLKDRWTEDFPKYAWMSAQFLRDQANKFDLEEVVEERKDTRQTRRSSRRSSGRNTAD